jgi:hypothetical protein
MKNTKHMGKNEKAMYNFAQKHLTGGRIHSLAKDATTQRTARQLVQRGLITINENNQFTLKEG